MPSCIAVLFILATKDGMAPASQRASVSAKLLAECTKRPSSSCRSVKTSPNVTCALA